MLRGGSRLYYNRRSTIVYPPVETTFYTPAPDVPPRRRVSSSCRPWCPTNASIWPSPRPGARSVPLTIVGDGPERARLEASAGGDVRFLRLVHATKRFATSTARRSRRCCRAKRISASSRSKRRPAAGRSWRSKSGGALETVIDGETGVLVEPGEEALADGLHRAAATIVGRRAHPPARRALQPRPFRPPKSATPSTRRWPPRRGIDGKALQPAAGRVSRRHRRPAGHGGVHPRVFRPLRNRLHPRRRRASRRSRSTSTSCRSSR